MKQKTILVADDEPNILILMEQVLEQLEEEYAVELIMVKNGEEALEIIQKKQPDLVFLDVMMPGMSGLDVCNIVKNEFNLTDVYIIMLTARGQEFDRVSGIAVGADLYITKPFRPRDILQKSLEILDLS